MPIILSEKDKSRLLHLAEKQAKIASSPKMQKLIKEWEAHGRFEKNTRPMILIELGTFASDIIPQLMECESEQARSIEWGFLSRIVNHELFDDDTVVAPYVGYSCGGWLSPFDIPVETVRAENKDGDRLGHHFISKIVDLEEDFHKLKKSPIYVGDPVATENAINEWNEIFGDIVPAKRTGSALYACPTQAIVHIMDMEDMFTAMCDYPDLFHKMMDMLTDDYVELNKKLSDSGVLRSTTSFEGVAQGTYAFTDKLHSDLDKYTSNDIWGFLDSQETQGISPTMFNEFIFPYYKKIADTYGLLSYGCCEAVDLIWKDSISKFTNLSKVSISPWCNEKYMGEQLAGKEIMYLRKPSPNLIGVGSELDEDATRKHISATVEAAQGCTLEFVQRDVYKINNTYHKVRRYVEIIRECCEKHR